MNMDLGRVPFNLMESWEWIHREKWNIVWADDESWLPHDASVLTKHCLPHGFHKVLVSDTDPDFLDVGTLITHLQQRSAIMGTLAGRALP